MCVCVCTSQRVWSSSLPDLCARVCVRTVCAAMCLPTLTQHNEVDLAPVVLPPSLDFTVVFPGVGQQQVADQQGGVAAQVLPGEGQAAGLAARGLVGVHLAPEEGNDLDTSKREGNCVYLCLFSIVFNLSQTVRCNRIPHTAAIHTKAASEFAFTYSKDDDLYQLPNCILKLWDG